MKDYDLENLKRPKIYTDEFVLFLGTMEEEYPGYDYESFGNTLLNMSVEKGEAEGYYNFDRNNDTLIMNTEKIRKDSADVRHLLYRGMLDACTNKDSVKDEREKILFDGIGRMMVLALPVPDEGKFQKDVLSYTLLSSLSYIVEPEVLVQSFMTNSTFPIKRSLQESGISLSHFEIFLDSLKEMEDPSIQDNRAYGDAQLLLINMFETKTIRDLSTGKTKPGKMKVLLDDFGELMDVDSDMDKTTLDMNEFGATFVPGKTHLLATYPQYNFSEMRLNSEEKKKMWAVTRANIHNLVDELSLYGVQQTIEEPNLGRSRAA